MGVLLLGVCSIATQAQSNSSDVRSAYDAAMAVSEPADRIVALQRFIQNYPSSELVDNAREDAARGLAALGEVQLTERNIERALDYFKQSVAISPGKMSDKFFDETASRIPLVISLRGYRAEAVGLAREMEVRFIGDARKLALLGEFYLTIEDAEDALRVLRIATRLAPKEARYHRSLGIAYRLNLKLDEAAEEYKAAIGLEPDDKRTYYDLANIQRGLGAYEEAIKLYRRQLEIDPQHSDSHKGLALSYIAQGKNDLANSELKQVSDKPDFNFQTQLAFAYLTRGRIAEARQSADSALAIEPRFSWARIAAAEVDLAEAKYFEAERNLLAALNYANFPTLYFTFGKVYLAVEDFDGAVEQFNKAIRYSSGKFRTRLGGVLDLESESLSQLLARERWAAIFKAESITSQIEYEIAEGLIRLDSGLQKQRPTAGTISALALSQSSSKQQASDLDNAVSTFVNAESSRRPFRALYAAQRLIRSGQLLERALKLADEAMDAAEAATAPEGSIRDYPNYDREGRLQLFRGRAGELRGWALQKLGRSNEAIAALEAAIQAYGLLPERKRALWRLASAKESAGQEREALEMYLAAYEPPDKQSSSADLNRAVIESLYRKLNGSLQGLDDRIGRAQAQPVSLIAFGPRSGSEARSNRSAKPITESHPASQVESQTENRIASTNEISDAAKTEVNAGREATPDSKPEAKSEVVELKPESKQEPKAELNADAKTEAKAESKGETEIAINTEKNSPAATPVIENTPGTEKSLPAETKAEDTSAAIVLPDNLSPGKVDLSVQNSVNTELATLSVPAEEDLDAPLPRKQTLESRAVRTEVERPIELTSTNAVVELPETPNLPGWRERPAALAGWAQLNTLFWPDGLSFAFANEETESAPEPSEIVTRPVVKEAEKETVVSVPRPAPVSNSKTSRASKLPPEIQKRAAAVGLSSGKISRSLVLGPEKPSNSEKPKPEQNTQAESQAQPGEASTPAPSTRPRRVAEPKPETPEPKSNATSQRKRRVIQ